MTLQIDANSKVTGIYTGTFPADATGTLVQVPEGSSYSLGDTYAYSEAEAD